MYQLPILLKLNGIASSFFLADPTQQDGGTDGKGASCFCSRCPQERAADIFGKEERRG